MPNPKPLPTITGRRVEMINRYCFGIRFGYPWSRMNPGDFCIVPENIRSPAMVRKAVWARAHRHNERYQTKRSADGVIILRLS